MSAIETMSPSATPPLSMWRRIARTFWTAIGERRQLRRTRIHLMELSDAELADIGLTREIADREASRSLMACYLNNSR